MKATPPSEYYDDPDKLIEFVEAGKNAEKMLEKADKNSKEHGAMSIVGATKEDLERMGLTPGSSEELSGTSLSKEASITSMPSFTLLTSLSNIGIKTSKGGFSLFFQ